MVSDVLDLVGTFLSIEKLKEIYLMDNIDPISYITARTVVTKYSTKNKEGKNLEIIRPVIPINIHIINTCKKVHEPIIKI